MRWLEVTVNAPEGERTYLVRDLGIIQEGLYRIVGSMPQGSIYDDRFKLKKQFNDHGTDKLVVGSRIVAQALKETRRCEKFDYVLIPGIIRKVYDPRDERYVQLELPFT